MGMQAARRLAQQREQCWNQCWSYHRAQSSGLHHTICKAILSMPAKVSCQTVVEFLIQACAASTALQSPQLAGFDVPRPAPITQADLQLLLDARPAACWRLLIWQMAYKMSWPSSLLMLETGPAETCWIAGQRDIELHMWLPMHLIGMHPRQTLASSFQRAV